MRNKRKATILIGIALAILAATVINGLMLTLIITVIAINVIRVLALYK